MAILNACTVLRDRLKPYRDRMPGKSWDDWVGKAYFERVPLFASGFYATPGIRTYLNSLFFVQSKSAEVSRMQTSLSSNHLPFVHISSNRSTGLDYDPKTNTGRWFDYATYGAGCSVVEIDCLTGDHSVLKTDIVMDLGESLNPAIDIGQIEGAFAQVSQFFSFPGFPISIIQYVLPSCPTCAD